MKNNLPEPAYPADTHVKGWRFEIDHVRLNQSDTWALAPADMRPWLLMMWHVGWQQKPAGSFSNNDEVIAAKIGMDIRTFRGNREVLMRGWELHSDGRLYHPVIVDQVLAYLDKAERERIKKANYRDRQRQAAATVYPVSPVDTQGTPGGRTAQELELERRRSREALSIGRYGKDYDNTPIATPPFTNLHKPRQAFRRSGS